PRNPWARCASGLPAREPAPGIGFGLSVALIEDGTAAGEALPDGTFGWDGVATRRFWVCPSGRWSAFYYALDAGVQREIEAAVPPALSGGSVTTVNLDAGGPRLSMTAQEQQIRRPGDLVSAAIIDAPGAEPHGGAMPLVARVAGTTLLQVLAAPLNPLDLAIASGAFHSARYEVPYAPGSECAGTVLEADRYAAGARA